MVASLLFVLKPRLSPPPTPRPRPAKLLFDHGSSSSSELLKLWSSIAEDFSRLPPDLVLAFAADKDLVRVKDNNAAIAGSGPCWDIILSDRAF